MWWFDVLWTGCLMRRHFQSEWGCRLNRKWDFRCRRRSPEGHWRAPPARLKITLKSPKIREGAALRTAPVGDLAILLRRIWNRRRESLSASSLLPEALISSRAWQEVGSRRLSCQSFLCWFPPWCTWPTSTHVQLWPSEVFFSLALLHVGVWNVASPPTSCSTAPENQTSAGVVHLKFGPN